MKIRPLQDRIHVKRIEEEETTAGAIIISDTAKERSQKGKVVARDKVVAVGKGRNREDDVLGIVE